MANALTSRALCWEKAALPRALVMMSATMAWVSGEDTGGAAERRAAAAGKARAQAAARNLFTPDRLTAVVLRAVRLHPNRRA